MFIPVLAPAMELEPTWDAELKPCRDPMELGLELVALPVLKILKSNPFILLVPGLFMPLIPSMEGWLEPMLPLDIPAKEEEEPEAPEGGGAKRGAALCCCCLDELPKPVSKSPPPLLPLGFGMVAKGCIVLPVLLFLPVFTKRLFISKPL